MNSPKLRFKEFNDEWNLNKLKDFSNRVTRKNKDNLSKLPLTISAQDGLVDQISFFNKTVASKDLSGYYLLYNGDFAYNKSYSNGYPWGTIKRLDKYDMGVLSTLYICFKPNSTINSNFLVQLFNSTVWYSGISEIAVEGARNHGLLNISVSDFFETIYKIPSIEEQTKIANFLSLIDRKIELQEKLVENLKLYKKGLLQKVFSNNLGWKSAKLGDLGNTYTGLSGKSKEDFKNGNSKFITYMNVFSNCISNNQQLENISINSNETQNKVKYGDIFFTTSSETPKEVGMSSVWLFNDDNIYLNSFCFGFRLNNITNFNIKFLAYLLRSYLIRKKIIFLAQGSTRYNISKNELMNLEILYPSIEEQNRIANLFSNLDKKMDFETNRLTNLKEYKKGLLQQMFI